MFSFYLTLSGGDFVGLAIIVGLAYAAIKFFSLLPD